MERRWQDEVLFIIYEKLFGVEGKLFRVRCEKDPPCGEGGRMPLLLNHHQRNQNLLNKPKEKPAKHGFYHQPCHGQIATHA